MWKPLTSMVVIGSLGLAPLAGCENLPGNKKQQGAVIGGVGGAAAGAAISKDNRVLGALIGGALGAGGGYLIGANVEKNKDKSDDEIKKDAQAAADNAKVSPATPEQARTAQSADINDDGFVTLDEVVAMEKAGLSDPEMIRRLERTQQYFELSPEQRNFLHENGVSKRVVTAMAEMQPEKEARLATEKQESDVEMRTDRNRQ